MKENNLDKLFSFIEDPIVREKLIQSEDRIRRSYNELFSGYSLTADNVLNDVLRVKNYTGIIEIKNINFYSFCEHHFAPFFGTCDVYYQPNEIITGLGKIVRLVRDVHAKRLQIQEIFNKDIADDIMRVLNAKGVYVESTAKHLCVCSRGPSDDTAETKVTYSLGSLKDWYKNK
ncbi:GTP cyclohydrolase 1 [Dokdonia pacifica]|uniref:GTP cyclohydrolase I n=1 Tax=Dokdonia pacifica TaxID=1627892 RepID=A0A239CF22_9FLAO|nr:GTP cyclohydrolase I [Dokdonia pacifica]GGG25419.1 GTP cyclohydrolase 1 [Dokdonia pacifica]SNS18569.1 GTP cyclohydrolase I [Dokdonia pacifica]